MVGDKLIDLECGWNAGVKKSILVRTGYGAELERESPPAAGSAIIVDHVTGDRTASTDLQVYTAS